MYFWNADMGLRATTKIRYCKVKIDTDQLWTLTAIMGHKSSGYPIASFPCFTVITYVENVLQTTK